MRKTKRESRDATKLFDHIKELRMRFIVSVAVLLVVGGIVYAFYEPILELLRSPLGTQLYYTSPSGGFAFIMKICFMGALAITIPVIVYNLIMFARPAFEEALPIKRVYMMTLASGLLSFSGAAFGFFYIIPGALHFFAGFQVSGLSALISADNYLNFVTNVIITFILLFQLPLLIGFIDKVKPLTPKILFGMEKWVILGSFVISLIVPFAFDLMTTVLIALPIIVLYNISIIIVLVQHARAHQAEKKVIRAQNKLAYKAMTASPLLLDELSFDDLLDDVITTSLFGNQTAYFNVATEDPQPVIPAVHTARRPGMDIRPIHSQPARVVPAAWVNRVASPIDINPRARVISDMRSVRSSRALTSQ